MEGRWRPAGEHRFPHAVPLPGPVVDRWRRRHDGSELWRVKQALPGDSNGDGVFDSGDLLQVFQAGKYEDGIPDNATFAEGDWNEDGDFDSADMVFVFQAGTYVAAATPVSSAIASAVDWLFAENRHGKNGLFPQASAGRE